MKYVNLIVNVGSLDEDECEVIEAEISELIIYNSVKTKKARLLQRAFSLYQLLLIR
jgi:hypothetical protein